MIEVNNHKRLIQQTVIGSIAVGLSLISLAIRADNTASPTYLRPPMSAYSAMMDDPLLGNRYKKPIWNLHDTLKLPDWLTLSVNQRTRYESLADNFRANASSGDQQIALQNDVWLQARFNTFRAAAEFLDSRALNADKGSNVNNTMVDTADFIQGYFSWADPNAFSNGLGAEVKVGRQSLNLGSRRLVARNYFRNAINSFDGVDIHLLDKDKWQFNGFVTMPVLRLPSNSTDILNDKHQWDQPATGTWFSGGILEGYELFKGINSELYLYNLAEGNSYANLTRHRKYFTPGLRVYLKPAKGQFDFQAEGMGQFGTVHYDTHSTKVQQHEAWSEHVEVGYSFMLPWSPRFMLEYDYATGSKNPSKTSSTDSRFDPLYGARNFEFGATGIYGAFSRSNINSPGYKLFLSPRQDVQLTLQQRLVWLASASDCWGGAACTSSTNLILQPTKTSGSYVGDQIGLTGRYDFNSSLNIEAGYFHLFKGQFAKEGVAITSGRASTAPSGDTNYFYVQSQLRF